MSEAVATILAMVLMGSWIGFLVAYFTNKDIRTHTGLRRELANVHRDNRFWCNLSAERALELVKTEGKVAGLEADLANAAETIDDLESELDDTEVNPDQITIVCDPDTLFDEIIDITDVDPRLGPNS